MKGEPTAVLVSFVTKEERYVKILTIYAFNTICWRFDSFMELFIIQIQTEDGNNFRKKEAFTQLLCSQTLFKMTQSTSRYLLRTIKPFLFSLYSFPQLEQNTNVAEQQLTAHWRAWTAD